MPRPDGGDAADQYTHITGVKFVDYDAGAWAVLRKIHQIATAHSQSAPQPAAAQSHNLPAKSPDRHRDKPRLPVSQLFANETARSVPIR